MKIDTAMQAMKRMNRLVRLLTFADTLHLNDQRNELRERLASFLGIKSRDSRVVTSVIIGDRWHTQV